MKKILIIAGVAIVLLAAYLCLWPTPIAPVSWEVQPSSGYTGAHAVNDKLTKLELIDLNGEEGPEHVAIGKDGKLYAAVLSGNILRMNPDGSEPEVFVNTGGRVLGFDFDAAGNLIAADAMKGLLSIAADKTVTVLASEVNGEPILYANAVVVASSGHVFFTDASARFAPAKWGGTFEASVLDVLEQSATGRVLEYDPAAKTTRVVAKGLSFANGLALSRYELNLFVSETGRHRVWKIAVTAQNLDVRQPEARGQARVLLDNLPGYPDNLMRGLDGRIWLGLAKPRNPVIDKMADKPFLRALTLRLPRFLWPIPKSYGHVVAFNEEGQIVADLQDPSRAYPETTSVTETRERLYIQSLHAKSLGWLPK